MKKARGWEASRLCCVRRRPSDSASAESPACCAEPQQAEPEERQGGAAIRHMEALRECGQMAAVTLEDVLEDIRRGPSREEIIVELTAEGQQTRANERAALADAANPAGRPRHGAQRFLNRGITDSQVLQIDPGDVRTSVQCRNLEEEVDILVAGTGEVWIEREIDRSSHQL